MGLHAAWPVVGVARRRGWSASVSSCSVSVNRMLLSRMLVPSSRSRMITRRPGLHLLGLASLTSLGCAWLALRLRSPARTDGSAVRLRLTLAVGHLLGFAVGRLAPWRRAVVRDNLRRLPGTPASLLPALERRAYVHLGQALVLSVVGGPWLDRHLEPPQLSTLLADLQAGGVLMCSAHLGMWELVPQLLAPFLPEHARRHGLIVYRPLHNKRLDRCAHLPATAPSGSSSPPPCDRRSLRPNRRRAAPATAANDLRRGAPARPRRTAGHAPRAACGRPRGHAARPAPVTRGRACHPAGPRRRVQPWARRAASGHGCTSVVCAVAARRRRRRHTAAPALPSDEARVTCRADAAGMDSWSRQGIQCRARAGVRGCAERRHREPPGAVLLVASKVCAETGAIKSMLYSSLIDNFRKYC